MLTVLPGGKIGSDIHGETAPRPLLVCFSHLRWDFVRQRPQHLMVRAAETYDVLFLEEPITGAVSSPLLQVSCREPDVRVAVPVLPDGTDGPAALAAQRDLLDGWLAGDRRPIRVAWYYTPMAMPFSDHLAAEIVVYDNMDELSAFRGASPEMLSNEDALFAAADLVFTGGMSLYRAKRHRHPRVMAFPSSIDAAHFAAARGGFAAEPADQAAIPRPRLGFFSVIDERTDLDLLARMAELRPDWQFVMVGPVVKIDPASLPERANIHWLGQKSYEELPAYLAGWDLGFMPFALNEATRFISPTKTPEYLAAGVPLLSTAIADVVSPYGENGLVEIAEGAEEMVLRAEALMSRPRAPWLEAVDRHLRTCSWDLTWGEMRAAIAEAERRGAVPAARGQAAAAIA